MLVRSSYFEPASLPTTGIQLNRSFWLLDLLAIYTWQLLFLIHRYKPAYTVGKHLLLAQLGGVHS